MTPEEICRIFTETALKPEKCIDFNIQYVSSSVVHIFPVTKLLHNSSGSRNMIWPEKNPDSLK